MQAITNILFLHPFVVEFSIIFAALAVALFLSFCGGKKLFISLAAKSRKVASIAAFVWYAALFFYFSGIIFVLPHAALLDIGFSQDNINRLYFATGNYPIVFFFIFLMGGAAMLFISIKKLTASIPAPTPVSLARSVWNGTRRTFLIIVLVFLALVISRVPAVQDKQRTAEIVSKIHSQKITLADVIGNNLPPEPDPRLKDYTIEGIDANGNGIRDDVELAIFKLHPDSARIRAAELQRAKAMQIGMTEVFNSETQIAMLQENSRGYFCISDTGPEVSLSDSQEKISRAFAVTDAREKEVEDLVLNIKERKAMWEENYEKYSITYSDLPGSHCDIDLTSLPN